MGQLAASVIVPENVCLLWAGNIAAEARRAKAG